jgi:uncharacterized membrane protein YgaE (UPF0421/DUF939 family)
VGSSSAPVRGDCGDHRLEHELGQQRRLATELALGVAVGILIADLLVRGIGNGGWQIAVLVVLAMSTALLVGGGPELVTEAGVSAILLATVQVPTAVSHLIASSMR